MSLAVGDWSSVRQTHNNQPKKPKNSYGTEKRDREERRKSARPRAKERRQGRRAAACARRLTVGPQTRRGFTSGCIAGRCVAGGLVAHGRQRKLRRPRPKAACGPIPLGGLPKNANRHCRFQTKPPKGQHHGNTKQKLESGQCKEGKSEGQRSQADQRREGRRPSPQTKPAALGATLLRAFDTTRRRVNIFKDFQQLFAPS